MAELFPVAGSKLYIGGVLASKATDFVEADFNGQSWTLIDGWSQMGGIGDAAQTLTKAVINRGRDIKQKGTANAGSMQNVFGIIDDDAGQIALIAAAQPSNKSNYAYKIELPNGSSRLFIALAMSNQEAGGEANSFADMNVTLEVNSNIVRVAAA